MSEYPEDEKYVGKSNQMSEYPKDEKPVGKGNSKGMRMSKFSTDESECPENEKPEEIRNNKGMPNEFPGGAIPLNKIVKRSYIYKITRYIFVLYNKNYFFK